MAVLRKGGCVCGAVRFVAKGEPLRVTCCHCTWCQRRTGTAFGTEVVYPEKQVQLTLGFNVQLKTHKHLSDETGRWLVHDFCPNCGGNIGLMLEAVPGIRTLAAGMFDDRDWLTPDQYEFRHVFMRSAQPWCSVPEEMEQYQLHFNN